MSEQPFIIWAEEWISSQCLPQLHHQFLHGVSHSVCLSPFLHPCGGQDSSVCVRHVVPPCWRLAGRSAVPMAQGRALAAEQGFLVSGTFHMHCFPIETGYILKKESVCLTEDLQGTLTVTGGSGQTEILPWVWEKLIRARAGIMSWYFPMKLFSLGDAQAPDHPLPCFSSQSLFRLCLTP